MCYRRSLAPCVLNHSVLVLLDRPTPSTLRLALRVARILYHSKALLTTPVYASYLHHLHYSLHLQCHVPKEASLPLHSLQARLPSQLTWSWWSLWTLLHQHLLSVRRFHAQRSLHRCTWQWDSSSRWPLDKLPYYAIRLNGPRHLPTTPGITHYYTISHLLVLIISSPDFSSPPTISFRALIRRRHSCSRQAVLHTRRVTCTLLFWTGSSSIIPHSRCLRGSTLWRVNLGWRRTSRANNPVTRKPQSWRLGTLTAQLSQPRHQKDSQRPRILPSLSLTVWRRGHYLWRRQASVRRTAYSVQKIGKWHSRTSSTSRSRQSTRYLGRVLQRHT